MKEVCWCLTLYRELPYRNSVCLQRILQRVIWGLTTNYW